MIALALDGVGHDILGRVLVRDIHLAVAPGEIVALVGPSGSGKSTLIQIAAGLIEPHLGSVQRRYGRHAVVFQEVSLLPWARAADNIAFPLKLAGLPRRQRAGRIEEVAERVSLLPEDLGKYPAQLSGGMKQRVAIARALAVRPDFIYFDEPFTALDVALRRRMQDLVIRARVGGWRAGLFVTHDLHEAARVADRIAVLDSRGVGVLGVRIVPGTPGTRDDMAVSDWVRSALRQDALFRHIDDVDERQSPCP